MSNIVEGLFCSREWFWRIERTIPHIFIPFVSRLVNIVIWKSHFGGLTFSTWKWILCVECSFVLSCEYFRTVENIFLHVSIPNMTMSQAAIIFKWFLESWYFLWLIALNGKHSNQAWIFKWFNQECTGVNYTHSHVIFYPFAFALQLAVKTVFFGVFSQKLTDEGTGCR